MVFNCAQYENKFFFFKKTGTCRLRFSMSEDSSMNLID